MTKQRIGAVAGIVAPILAFSLISASILTYEGFSWANNALSDLGVAPGVTPWLFNFGLVAAGLLSLAFAVLGLLSYLGKHYTGKIGALLFGLSSIALVFIGIFNESFSPTHYLVSVAFFLSAPIALFVLTCALAIYRQYRMAVFTVIIGVVAAVPWILEFTIYWVPNVAIPETISGAAVSAWAIVLGAKILAA